MDGDLADKYYHYKLSFGKHIRLLAYYLLYVVFILLYAAYVSISGIMLKEVGIAFLFVFIILTVATLNVHFEYYRYSRGLSIQIDFSKSQFVLIRHDKQRRYSFLDIEKIQLFIYPSMLIGSTKFFPTEAYYFARINMNTGDVLLLNNLLIPNLKEILKKTSANLEIKKVVYPSISMTI